MGTVGERNADKTGNYSAQVLKVALKSLQPSVELLELGNSDPRATAARKNPAAQQAYLFNHRSHWFAIKRFGDQWYNLDSMKSTPTILATKGNFIAPLLPDHNAFKKFDQVYVVL